MSGKRKVAAAIANARTVESSSSAGGGSEEPPRGGAPAWLMKRFKMEDDGLFKKSAEEEKTALWVCGPFQIEAETWMRIHGAGE